ncbi:MAG TPA: S8 family serine peptidase, partial [Urbifossiella sp.]
MARRAGGDLVLFEKGKPRSESTRRLLTRRIAVQLAAGQDATAIARAVGAESANPAPFAPNWYIFQSAAEPGSALEVTQKLKRQAGVVSVEPMLARQQTKRLIPSDPFFGNQWHLLNAGQVGGPSGIDINVTSVWNTYRGDGMNIGIVDDGLEHTHPDLAPNYQASLSYDFNYDSPDPQPAAFDGDDHGTACAGLAAAAGNNGIGVTGVAFNAGLAGIRLIALPDTDEQEAEAFALHDDIIAVKSNSWGPADDGKTLAGPGPLAIAGFENAVQTGRNGRGTIFTWAGGNGALNGDASTFDGYASSREVIAVGAITNSGVNSPYSEPGTNLICVAPSSGGRKDLAITTVDRAGEDGYNFDGFADLSDPDYTDTFGGTSAASPQAAGVIALMLQANPNLGWRDVQEILLRSARQIDLGNDNGVSEGWITNSAGFHFN